MEFTISDLYQKNGRLNSALIRREYFKQSELYRAIVEVSTKLGAVESSSLQERIFLYQTKTQIPTCQCGRRTSFNPKLNEYRPHCANKSCAAKLAASRALKTKHERYGAGNSPLAREKARERAANLNIIGRQTLLARSGVKNPSQLSDHAEKSRDTLRARYGVDHPGLIPKIRRERLERSKAFYESLITTDNVRVIDLKQTSEFKQQVYENPCFIVEVNCDVHGREDVPVETFKWRCRRLGTPCSRCLRPYNKSVGVAHSEIAKFIEELGERVITNDRTTIHPLELDVLVPDRKLAIEYHGLFWHSSDQLEPTEARGAHLRKLNLANAAGIELLQFFEDEWIYQRELVKSMLRVKLGKVEQKIFARRCTVDREVPAAEACRFLDENHLQGYCQSTVRIGLREGSKLVMLITVGADRFSKSAQLELLRVCSLRDTIVVGGFRRLLRVLAEDRAGSKLITYADRRYSTGRLYQNSGFTLASTSGPGYFWTDKDQRFSRQKFQKHKLSKLLAQYDPTKSEAENMFNHGYRRIWDCGQLRYETIL